MFHGMLRDIVLYRDQSSASDFWIANTFCYTYSHTVIPFVFPFMESKGYHHGPQPTEPLVVD